MRLVGDDAPMSGRLEVYIHDQWGSVCAGDGKFGYLEASIVCRSLNYKGVARGPFHVERFIIIKFNIIIKCMLFRTEFPAHSN